MVGYNTYAGFIVLILDDSSDSYAGIKVLLLDDSSDTYAGFIVLILDGSLQQVCWYQYTYIRGRDNIDIYIYCF